MKYEQMDFVDLLSEVEELKRKNEELNDFANSQTAKLLKELAKAKKDIEFLGVQTKTFLLMANMSKENENIVLEHISEIFRKWEITE